MFFKEIAGILEPRIMRLLNTCTILIKNSKRLILVLEVLHMVGLHAEEIRK